MNKLEGRIALVTGRNSGIGLATRSADSQWGGDRRFMRFESAVVDTGELRIPVRKVY
jgi:NADP-dependent 3-hydroxy acid dehydrogenase YdfG